MRRDTTVRVPMGMTDTIMDTTMDTIMATTDPTVTTVLVLAERARMDSEAALGRSVGKRSLSLGNS